MIARNYILDKPTLICAKCRHGCKIRTHPQRLRRRFTDPIEAATYLESIRWPNGPVCPHCGESEKRAAPAQVRDAEALKCAACRKQFTVTVGTIFEGSHIPLHKWLLAFYLLCSSKKGMSAHQLHRMLGSLQERLVHGAPHPLRDGAAPFRKAARAASLRPTRPTSAARSANRKRQDKQKKTGRGTDKTPVVVLVERGG